MARFFIVFFLCALFSLVARADSLDEIKMLYTPLIEAAIADDTATLAAQLPADMVVLFDDGVHLDNRIAVMDNLHSRMLSRLGNSAYRFDSLDIKTTIEKQDNFIITGQATLTRTATQEPDYTVTVPFTAVLGNQAGQHLAPLMLMVHYPSALLFAHSDKIQDNTSKKSERIYWFLIGCGLGLITLASIATLKRGLKNT